MNRSKFIFAIVVFVLLMVVAGFTVPLGTYTSSSGCPIDPTPKNRLHIIQGDSIRKIKEEDAQPQNPSAGCAANAEYTLYFF